MRKPAWDEGEGAAREGRDIMDLRADFRIGAAECSPGDAALFPHLRAA